MHRDNDTDGHDDDGDTGGTTAQGDRSTQRCIDYVDITRR